MSKTVTTKTIFDLMDVIQGNTGIGLLTDQYVPDSLPRFVKNGDPVNVVGVSYNQSRANISLQTIATGMVELPENDYNLDEVESTVFRNHVIVRDGVYVTNSLTLLVSEDVLDDLIDVFGEEAVELSQDTGYMDRQVVNIKLDMIPLVGDGFDEYLKNLPRDFSRLLELSATSKGMKHHQPPKVEKESFLSYKYGDDVVEWLKTVGVTDSGFNPRGSYDKTNIVTVPELVCKIKSLSSLPTVQKVIDKEELGKKMTLSESLIYSGYSAGLIAPNGINDHLRYSKNARRTLEQNISKAVFYAVIKGVDVKESHDVSFLKGDLTSTITIETVLKEIKV